MEADRPKAPTRLLSVLSDRARAQFALVRSMEELEPEMERIVSFLT